MSKFQLPREEKFRLMQLRIKRAIERRKLPARALTLNERISLQLSTVREGTRQKAVWPVEVWRLR